jgi:hypothetical protein
LREIKDTPNAFVEFEKAIICDPIKFDYYTALGETHQFWVPQNHESLEAALRVYTKAWNLYLGNSTVATPHAASEMLNRMGLALQNLNRLSESGAKPPE